MPLPPTKPYTIRRERIFIATSRKSIRKTLKILTSSSAVFHANHSAKRAAVYRSLIRGVLSFLSSQESLKPSDLAILSLKTFPDCLVLKRGTASRKSLPRFANWGIAYAGTVWVQKPLFLNQQRKTSESDSPDDGYSLSDVLESEVPSKYWLSERSTRKISGCL